MPRHNHPNPTIRRIYRRMKWERRAYALTVPFRRLWCKTFGHRPVVKMGGSYCANGCRTNVESRW